MCLLLRRTLDGNVSAPDDEKIWALTILAEAEARLGQTTEAETHFKKVLAMGKRDPYLLGAYADFLLDQGRAAEAAGLLKNENRADALLLRLALAESVIRPRPSTYDEAVAVLQARLTAITDVHAARGARADQSIEYQQVMEQLRAMPRDYSDPLLLAASGAAYEEIAAMLHVTVAAVKIRIHRARMRLKELRQ